jgi:hypothetical protein
VTPLSRTFCCQIGPFRAPVEELGLQGGLRRGRPGEHDEARGVAIDAVHDGGSPPSVRSPVLGHPIGHRLGFGVGRQRDRQEAGGFVHDDQVPVLEHDGKGAESPGRPA